MKSLGWALALVGTTLVGSLAHADPIEDSTPDKTTESVPPPERTWAYSDEPQLAAPGHAVVLSRLTATGDKDSPTRPFSSNLAVPGVVAGVGGEVGVYSHVSLVALAEAGPNQGRVHPGGIAGVRVSLLPSNWTRSHVVLAAGYLRELSGNNGTWGRVTGAWDVGRVRMLGSLHAEKVFQSGRDAIDLMVTTGVNYMIVKSLRAGLEYVGQDLEGGFSADEAEGGARHFLGPTLALSLLNDRLALVGGPALGLSAGSPRVLGRLAASFSF